MFKQIQKLLVLTKGPKTALFVVAVFFALGVMSWVKPATAATNSTINFQARLLTSAGSIVPDGDYNIEFKLYNAASSSGSSQGSCTGDANCLWTETRISTDKVRVVNGYLTVDLGSVTAFGGTISWDQELWLTMNVGGTVGPSWDGEMSPRLKLTSVPYAFRAGKLVGGSGSNVTILDTGTPSGTNTVSLPAETGILCVRTSSSCGFAPGTAGSYIQNTASEQATSNFYISGNGKATTSLQTALLDSISGALAIGTTNATAINLNQNTTIGASKTLTVTSGATTLTGATSGDALTVSNSSSTGNIAVFKDNTTEVFSIANGGTTTVSSTGDAAFVVQAADGTDALSVDTNGVTGVSIGGLASNQGILGIQGSTYTLPNIDGGALFSYYENVAAYSETVVGGAGIIKITLPVGWTNTMMRITINGYDYTTTTGGWQAVVSGYNYATTSEWYDTSAEIYGRAPFSTVRLGYDGSHVVILLGTSSTSWSYPKIEVSEVMVGHANTGGYGSGWSISRVANETGITFNPVHDGSYPIAPYYSSSSKTTFTGGLDVGLNGSENINITSDLAAGGNLTMMALTATPTTVNNSYKGLVVQQTDSANLYGLDYGIQINNLDTDLVMGYGLSINSAGGGFTTDIRLQNGEYITNSTDGTIALNAATVAPSGNIQLQNTYGIYFEGATLGNDSSRIYAPAASDRLYIRSEDTDNVANFSSYGMYLPRAAQTFGLAAESPISARGGIIDDGGALAIQAAEDGNVTIGTSSITGTLLVLDTKTSAGDPTGANGGMYYNSSMRVFRCYQNGTWHSCIGGVVLASQTSGAGGDTITSTDDTNFASYYQVPAYDCQPGKVYTVLAQGVYGTNASVYVTMRVKWGATILLATPTGNSVAGAVNLGWRLDAQITCIDSTHVEAQGWFQQINSGTGVGAYEVQMVNTATKVVTTSSAQNLYVGAEWSGANATIVMRQLIIRSEGPD